MVQKIEFCSSKCQSILFNRQKKIKAPDIKIQKKHNPHCKKSPSSRINIRSQSQLERTYKTIESNCIQKIEHNLIR